MTLVNCNNARCGVRLHVGRGECVDAPRICPKCRLDKDCLDEARKALDAHLAEHRANADR